MKKIRPFERRSQKLSNVRKIRHSNRETIRQEIIEYWYGEEHWQKTSRSVPV